jgi:hypothetical protein
VEAEGVALLLACVSLCVSYGFFGGGSFVA